MYSTLAKHARYHFATCQKYPDLRACQKYPDLRGFVAKLSRLVPRPPEDVWLIRDLPEVSRLNLLLARS